MNNTEKEVIYILNLIRTNPSFFAKNVLAQYPDKTGRGWLANTDYYRSLMDTLLKIPNQTVLLPDRKCYESALCHATSSGSIGGFGHERITKSCEKKQWGVHRLWRKQGTEYCIGSFDR
jgi:hypothetical protein